jgi:hypothetical protein
VISPAGVISNFIFLSFFIYISRHRHYLPRLIKVFLNFKNNKKAQKFFKISGLLNFLSFDEKTFI